MHTYHAHLKSVCSRPTKGADGRVLLDATSTIGRHLSSNGKEVFQPQTHLGKLVTLSGSLGSWPYQFEPPLRLRRQRVSLFFQPAAIHTANNASLLALRVADDKLA